MKLIRLFYLSTSILFGFLAVPACAASTAAETPVARSLTFLAPEVEIELALSAAPQQMRAEATVYLFEQTGNAKLKQGIDDGFKQGHFLSPRKTGIAYMLRGDIRIDPVSKVIDKVSFPPHYMIYAPGVSNADIGIDFKPTKESFSLPYIYAGYSGGTRNAYLIIMARENKAH